MSDKARALLVELVQELQSGDGATRLGSYQDVVADLLHLANKDEILRAEQNNPNNTDWIHTMDAIITNPGFSTFMEERWHKEVARIKEIPKKELPLYLNQDWEFPHDSKQYVEQRIKGER
jgi:hypothetical protein